MVDSTIQFEQHIARSLPEALHLQLHVLPAHQELIAPLPEGYVGPVMTAAEAWLKQHGYRTLGPWMIAWGQNGQPQLRRPVSGALKAVRDKTFYTIEVPEQLLLAVPFVGWPILPQNFTYPVTSVGLDIVGSPLLLALTNEPPTMAWVPVVPRGTQTLFGAQAGKLGLQPAAPNAGEQVSLWKSLLLSGFTTARFFTLATIGFIIMMSFLVLIGMSSGDIPLGTLDVAVISFFGFLLGAIFSIPIMIALAAIWFIASIVKFSALSKWNRFWQQRPAPPELLLGSRGEGNVGAWLK